MMAALRGSLLGVLVVLLILSSACLPQSTPRPQITLSTPDSGLGTIEGTPESGDDVETQVVLPTARPGAPPDVPIMEGAYRLQIMRDGRNIIFQIDTDIETVVGYYQQQLPFYGWEMAGAPDSVVSSIASMLRENANEDRLTLNLQENKKGGFVTVTIAVVRSP